jgi:hypothetical protein
MAKNKISEFSSTPANNTDIAGINIAEGCAPSGINNAIRELMAQLKDQQAGTDGDSFTVGGGFTSVGAAVFSSTVAVAGATTFSSSVVMSNSVSMNGNNNIGNTTSSTILSGSVTQTSSSKLYLDDSATTASAPPLSWDGDSNTGIYRPAADTLALVTGGSDRLRINSSGVVIVGSGEATSTVSGKVLRSPDASGTNITGANFEINAGNGTGTGGSGSIVIKTAPPDTTGSVANTMTQRLLITKNGGFSFGSGATDYGITGQVLKSNGDAPPSFGSFISSGTAKSYNWNGLTTNKYIDFENIPSGVSRIQVVLQGVSTSGTSNFQIQLGTGATPTYETTGYTSTCVNTAGTSSGTVTSGFIIYNSISTASDAITSIITFVKFSDNTWVSSGTGVVIGGGGRISSGNISLGNPITAVRLTTISGVENFDAGSVNIIYE